MTAWRGLPEAKEDWKAKLEKECVLLKCDRAQKAFFLTLLFVCNATTSEP